MSASNTKNAANVISGSPDSERMDVTVGQLDVVVVAAAGNSGVQPSRLEVCQKWFDVLERPRGAQWGACPCDGNHVGAAKCAVLLYSPAESVAIVKSAFAADAKRQATSAQVYGAESKGR